VTNDERPGEADEVGVGRWLVRRTFCGGDSEGKGSSTGAAGWRNGLFVMGSFSMRP
jgi:hypothetical protein